MDSNKEIGARIKDRRKEVNMTLQEVATRVGVQNSTISRYESGSIKSPKIPIIEAIARALDVNPDWLIGKSKKKETKPELPPGLSPIPHTVQKPRVGSIACGSPALAEQNIECYDRVPDWVHCDFTLRCKGDSMIGARIYDGDVVCIRQQPEVETGEIAAVLIGSEATLKRVYDLGDTLMLRPENPAYKELIYRGSERADVRILGLAVYLIGPIK